jgi:hypothetical protein
MGELELYNKFQLHLTNLVVMLDGVVPDDLFTEVEFFINEPYITPTCRTNTTLAYRIGKLSGMATGKHSVLLRALYLLVIARDSMIKGCPEPGVMHLIHNVGLLIQAGKIWQTSELNHG